VKSLESTPSFPGFHGFLESQNSIPEKPGKAWKAKKKYSILSWLFPVCKKHGKGLENRAFQAFVVF